MNHIDTSGVIDVNISDHQPIYIIKKENPLHSAKKHIWGRSYKNYIKDPLIQNLRNIGTIHIYSRNLTLINAGKTYSTNSLPKQTHYTHSQSINYHQSINSSPEW